MLKKGVCALFAVCIALMVTLPSHANAKIFRADVTFDVPADLVGAWQDTIPRGIDRK